MEVHTQISLHILHAGGTNRCRRSLVYLFRISRNMVTPASSWQEWHQHKYSGDARQLAFLSAHAWQHESLQLRAVSNDGFLVMVGLFLVLILENIWSFDPGAFSSVALANGFVTALVLGAACGLFTLFSTAMVTAKLKRLLARDTCNLHVQQPGKHKKSSLDRLVRRWQQYPADHQWQAASEWSPAIIGMAIVD